MEGQRDATDVVVSFATSLRTRLKWIAHKWGEEMLTEFTWLIIEMSGRLLST